MLADWQHAPVTEPVRAALGFLQKLTLTPGEVEVADVKALRAAGIPDGGIREALYVCFCFNVLDRLADALDFTRYDGDGYEAAGQFLFKHGYKRVSIPG